MTDSFTVCTMLPVVLLTLFSITDSSVASSKDYDIFNLTLDPVPEADEKHQMFKSCLAFPLEPGEYIMFSNGTAYVEAYNKTYNSSFYILEGEILTVCAPNMEIEEKNDEDGGNTRYHLAFQYVTQVCLGISIVCLLLHLAVFCFIPELRNLPGYNKASLCTALLFSYISFLIPTHPGLETTGTPCVVIAVMIQYFLLASFMWMAVMAFDVFISVLKATWKLRLTTRKFSVKRYLMYSSFAWGIPLVLVVSTLLMDYLEGVPEIYRPMLGQDICWFRGKQALILTFAAPVFAVIILNILLFAASAYIIFSNRMTHEEMAYRTRMRKNFTMHCRLATIMGITWVVGFANTSSSFWLLYVYILLSCLQGLFIFLACTCTSKVRGYIRKRINFRVRKVSTLSTPTFQSYWNEEFPATCSVYIVPTESKNSHASQ